MIRLVRRRLKKRRWLKAERHYRKCIGAIRWVHQVAGYGWISEIEIRDGMERCAELLPDLANASMVTAQQAADGFAKLAAAGRL